jgi:hypothetical protein
MKIFFLETSHPWPCGTGGPAASRHRGQVARESGRKHVTLGFEKMLLARFPCFSPIKQRGSSTPP